MIDREIVGVCLRKIAWGYLFLYFNIKLGTLNILPAFAGYLLFLSAINVLSAVKRELEYLRIPSLMLFSVHIAYWFGELVNVNISGIFPFVSLIVGILNMYFHFQLITNVADIVYDYAGDEEERIYAARLMSLRTAQTVILTVMMVVESIYSLIGEAGGYINIAASVVYIILGICVMSALFGAAKNSRTEAQE